MANVNDRERRIQEQLLAEYEIAQGIQYYEAHQTSAF